MDALTDPIVDPSRLCPWCDEVLADHISPQLASLIADAIPASYECPRPGNILGLTADVKVFSAVCARHDFEKTELVIALAEGWPTHINWEGFIKRVIDVGPELQRIINDVDEDWQPLKDGAKPIKHVKQPLDEDPQALAERPRKESFLWKSIVNDITARGSLAMAGINGQYMDFDKKLPG